MRKDNSIYNKKQPGLYIYLYLQSQIPTSCYSGKKTIRHFHGKISPYFRFSKKNRHKAQRKAKFYINKCRSASCMQSGWKRTPA